MADISTELLADLMPFLQTGKSFQEFIVENNLQSQIRTGELRRQFIQSFGQEVLRDIMKSSMGNRMSSRFSKMAERMTDVDQIDKLILSLTSSIESLQAKKDSLLA